MDSRNFSRSLDHASWWEPESRKVRAPRSITSLSLEGRPLEDWQAQEQARFQQKQMAEREMKIASLYEAQQARALTRVRHSPGAPASPAASSPPQNLQVQPGKVRQMFEERRTKGIDKSYPLKPINNNTMSRQVNGHAKVTVTTATSGSKSSVSEKKTVKSSISTHSLVRKQKIDNMFDGSGDLNHNHELSPDGVHDPEPAAAKGASEGADEADGYRLEDETFPEALAPARTPRATPPPAPHNKNPPKVNGVVTAKAQTTPAPRRPAPAPAPAPAAASAADTTTGSDTAKGRAGATGAKQRAANPVSSQQKRSPANVNSASSVKAKPAGPKAAARASSSAPAEAGAGEGAACAVCGRRFAPDRLDKHQSICKKARTKKRKPFDALKHRLAGTEAEPFIMKARRSGAAAGGAGATTGAGGKVGSNSNWRQKHEDFIRAIRAAKQVQAHLNAGGKLSELPPPPPSENPDYVACPSCKRRFNRAAADRHIPKCATYQFNKPKAQPAKRR